jgi:hypothetical protein
MLDVVLRKIVLLWAEIHNSIVLDHRECPRRNTNTPWSHEDSVFTDVGYRSEFSQDKIGKTINCYMGQPNVIVCNHQDLGAILYQMASA